MPNEKKYSQMEFDEASFDGWRQEYDPRALVRIILECEHTSVGKSVIDGIEVEGFRKTEPGGLTIWVDVETRLPVRMEGQMDMGKNKEIKAQVHLLVYDFQWDVPVDAADFEPVIPADYTPGRPMLQMFPPKKTNSE